MDARWRIELFGGLRALQGDHVVTSFRTRQTGVLLAYLAYFLHRAHLREQLVDLLWPEADPDAGRHRLRLALSALRHQLEPSGVPPGAVLIADRTSVRLNPAAVATDVNEFEMALEYAARAASSVERADWLAHAVELYRGELLPGLYDDWILQEREWLAERYFQALGQLIAHLEGAGDLDRVLQVARQGIRSDPLREETHVAVMRLYAAVGQPEAALRQYRELERLLQQELEATPSAATRALVRDIERLSMLPAPTVAPTRISGAQAGPPSSEPLRAPPEGENRLVTVLFADMSRSVEATRDLHPEDAAALVNRLLGVMVDALLKYEGRIDRFLGDGVLAVFGTLQAHEDDPERAIRAALEIREAAQKLALEVTAGINTGEVYVGAVGSERHQEMTVVGPVVNLASRLQEQAEPGQVLVGETTYRQTRRAFDFTALSLALKGLAQPVAAYAVARALPRPEKARGIEGLRAALIGRDEELAKLQAALTEVLQGRGQMISLIGEAGVGKSRLIAELKLAALADGASGRVADGAKQQDPLSRPVAPSPTRPVPLWLEGRCLELGMTAGYSLFVDLFRDYFAARHAEEHGGQMAQLAAALREFVTEHHLSPERADEIGPLLANLLSLRAGNDWDLRLKNASPEQIRHQTLLAVHDFLVALSQQQPLVLVLEDLHWADTLSMGLIALLMQALSRGPLLLVCAYRPEREHKCSYLATIASRKCPDCYTELPLRELTPPQSRRLVEALLTIDRLPDAVKDRILEKSHGNPFFVEEVVRALIDTGRIYREGDAWRAREGIELLAVPESIQSVILSRVDHLDPAARRVLESASIMGRLFRRRILGQMIGEEPALERVLWELEDQGLIYPERVVPEEEYSFKHVLTQETIYQSILRRRRSLLHQGVAEAMEALYAESLDEHDEVLAYHYERSGDDAKAVEYLIKAGEKSRRAYLNEAAIGYFHRGWRGWISGRGARIGRSGASRRSMAWVGSTSAWVSMRRRRLTCKKRSLWDGLWRWLPRSWCASSHS